MIVKSMACHCRGSRGILGGIVADAQTQNQLCIVISPEGEGLSGVSPGEDGELGCEVVGFGRARL